MAHDHRTLTFPDGFLWGAASSAYQVEGEARDADWEKFKSAGEACDEYNRYSDDFKLAQDLGHNAHRLSIEWSRIEPRQGEFDPAEIDHYRDVLKDLKKRKMTVMLTLWHFTLPQWVADQGGWNSASTIGHFVKFVERIVPELDEYVDFWITLNEPNVYIYMLYTERAWPGAVKGQGRTTWMFLNLVRAHRRAYKAIKKLSKKPVGIANNLQSYEPYHRHSVTEQIAVMAADIWGNHLFYFLSSHCHDFLGINYYFHHRIKHFSLSDLFKKGAAAELINPTEQAREVSDLGWEINPQGLFDVLADMSDHVPIYITECGIASTNDDRRTRFLINYTSEVYRAVASGIRVKGFFYWSLLDNFEWHRGFEPRFGLIEMDYKTQKRTVRKSALVYREIIKHNGIPHHLLKLLAHGLHTDEITEIIETDR